MAGAYTLVRTGPSLRLPPVSGDGPTAAAVEVKKFEADPDALRSIYESYSLRFPHPDAVGEAGAGAGSGAGAGRRRGRAGEGGDSGGAVPRPDPGGGFFRRLFGWGGTATDPAEGAGGSAGRGGGGHSPQPPPPRPPPPPPPRPGRGGAAANPPAPLCGTDAFDPSAIPPEARGSARFHLASAALAGPPCDRGWCASVPLRTGGASARGGGAGAVVGWGQIAELQASGGGGGEVVRPSLSLTSDAPLLRASIGTREAARWPERGRAAAADLRHVRAAALGPDCLAISWGGPDGTVVLYRRVRDGGDVRWDAVARIDPSPDAVGAAGRSMSVPADGAGARGGGGDGRRKRKGERQSDQSELEGRLDPFGVDLMRVTDLVPVVVVDDGEAGTTMLALSRLGGYIEIIPLPAELCSGPVPSFQRTRGPACVGREFDHYAASVPALRVEGAATVSVGAYHKDLTALDVCRTSASAGGADWDRNARPDAPPADFLLAAAGSGVKDAVASGECVTLWGVASVSSPHDRASTGTNSDRRAQEVGDSVRVGLVGIIDRINVGPPVTCFASDVTVRQWYHRPERSVRRRLEEGAADEAGISQSLPWERELQHRCTVTTAAPFQSLRFSPSGQSHLSLLALDYNGGMTVLDCTAACRFATREQEPAPSKGDSDVSAVIAIDILKGRESAWWANGEIKPILKAGWWLADPSETGQEDQSPGPLVVALTQSGGLHAHQLYNRGVTTNLVFRTDLSWQSDDGGLSALSFIDSPQASETFPFFILNSRELFPCAVKKINARKLLVSLVDEKRYEEALGAAIELGEDAMTSTARDACYKALWAEKFDVDALLQVEDDAYVIDIAFSLGENEASRLSLEQIQSIYLDALGRAPLDENVEYLRSRYLKACTYQLLAHRLSNGAEISALNFISCFLKEGTVLAIAKAFAIRGDIESLSLVFIRHYDEVGSNDSRGEVLTLLPLGLSVDLYSHLLPTHANKDGSIFTFRNDDGCCINLKVLDLVSRIENDPGILCFVNESDRKVFMKHLELTSFVQHKVIPTNVAKWFEARSRSIHKLTGSSDAAIAMLQCGLERLVNDDEGREKLSSILPGFTLMDRIINEGDILSEIDAATLSITDFEGLGLHGIVDLIFGDKAANYGTVGVAGVLSRYKRFLEPIVLEDGNALISRAWLDKDGSSNIRDLIPRAITSFCLKKLNSADSSRTVHMLEMCHAFATASKTAIPRHERIISNERDLTQFVMNVAYAPRMVMSRQVLDLMWALYECLPVRVKSRENSDESWAKQSLEIDRFYQHLLLVEISLRWCEDSTLLGTFDSLQENSKVLSIGCKTLAAMCDGFCLRIKSISSNEQEENDVILDFLSDVQEFNDLCFDSILPLDAELKGRLIRNLLRQYSFRALGSISSLKKEWFGDESAEALVSEFVRDAMEPPAHSRDDATIPVQTEKLRAAIQCQNILGPIFPNLRQEFENSRRYLDVVRFVNDVLNCDVGGPTSRGPLRSLSTFQATAPIKIIDSVLAENPTSIIAGLPDWGNAHFSERSNQDIALYFANLDSCEPSEVTFDASNLPPPPGEYVMQLADMIGFDKNSIKVRTMMVKCSSIAGYHGAAASICFLLLRDIFLRQQGGDSNSEDGELEKGLVQAVADLVASDLYTDIRMKKQLCTMAIQHLGHAQSLGSEIFHAILKLFHVLEAKSSSLDITNRTGELSPSSDMHELLNVLQFIDVDKDHAANNSLWNHLARNILLGCVSEIVQKPVRHDVSIFSIPSLLQLGIAILLELESEVSLSILHDVENAFEMETRYLKTSICLKSPSITAEEFIVQQLRVRGFSTNGARRAAVMTGNKDVNTAMLWAVAHFQDDGFEDPLIFLHNSGAGESLDLAQQSGILAVGHALAEARGIIKAEKTVSSFAGKRQGGKGDTRQSIKKGETVPGKRKPPQKPPAPVKLSQGEDENGGWDDFDEVVEDSPKAIQEPSLPNKEQMKLHLKEATPECWGISRSQTSPRRSSPSSSHYRFISGQASANLAKDRPDFDVAVRRKMASEGRRLLEQSRQAQSPSTILNRQAPSETTPLEAISGSSGERSRALPLPPRSSDVSDPKERQRLVMEGRRLLEEARKRRQATAAASDTNPSPCP